MIDINKVSDIKEGLNVEINCFNDMISGKVKRILSSVDNPRGIKVELESGEKGRIVKIINDDGQISSSLEQKTQEKKEKTNKVKEELLSLTNNEKKEKAIVINIDNDDKISTSSIIGGQKRFEVVTKFFQATYCKSLKSDIYGIVIFKVRAIEINIAVYKINLYLKKYCISPDIKYEVIKINSN